jgi:predicted ester cyclase
MTAIADKAIIHRLFEEVWNKGDEGVLREIFAARRYDEDFVIGPTRVSGMGEAFRVEVQSYRAFFPDLQFTLEDMAAEGATVIARWVARGTHTGTSRLGFGFTEGQAIHPTGRQMLAAGLSISRVADGQIWEHRQYWSPLSLLQVMAIESGSISPARLLSHWGYRPGETRLSEEPQPGL